MSFQLSEVKLDAGPSDKPALARPESKIQKTRVVSVVRLHERAKQVSSYIFGGDIERINDLKEKERQRQAILENAAKHAREFAAKEASECCFKLGVVPDKGLSTQEAETRREKVGYNELEKEDPPTILQLFIGQFGDILVWILIAAIIVSMGTGEYAAGATIIFIVIFNAVLGVKMELGAGRALEALENQNPPTSAVRRDGQIKEIPSREIVPGDIIILSLGNKVPADIRLIKSAGLATNEMQLTGESEPVKKDWAFVAEDDGDGDDDKKEADRVASALSSHAISGLPGAHDRNKDKDKDDDDAIKKTEQHELDVAKPPGEKKEEKATTFKNMVYMGSAIQDGNGEGVVVHTAMKTEMGSIAHLLNTADEGESPLQQKLDAMGEKLGMASLVCSVIVYVVGISTGRGAHNEEQSIYLSMLLVAVALTVAAVPEALPVCVTICLARGMAIMASVHKAQITKLKSVETLGSASVICTDKTGTLTKGEMTATRLWFDKKTYRFTGTGFDPTGYCVPIDTPQDDKAVEQAAEQIRDGLHRMPLLLGVLCSTASLQYNEKEKKWEAKGNSTERPLVVAGKKTGWEKDVLEKAFPKLKENAFNSAKKMMSTLHQCPQENDEYPYFGDAHMISVAKGAPNFILKNCVSIVTTDSDSKDGPVSTRPLEDKEKEEILRVIDDFSSQALRVLAIGYRVYDSKPESDDSDALESKLTFAGLICSIDPERDEVGPCIDRARDAGVRTVMITGDYVATAKAIAENIGIIPRGSDASRAVDCEKLREMGDEEERLGKRLEELQAKKDPKKAAKEKAQANKAKGITEAPPSDVELVHLTTEEEREVDREIKEIKEQLKELEDRLDKLTGHADVYARAMPKDKITIVRSLQRQGHVCAMTGDGVNDAPALRQANIGVAMGITGTDVAKSAADMVLLNDSFVSIIAAIEQGRITYANIQKFVFFLLSCNIPEVFLILFAVIIGLKSPLVPTQILWLNLTTDIFPALALAWEAVEPGVMNEGPRPLTEPVLEKVLLLGIFAQAIVMTGTTLGTYIIGLYWEIGTWNGDKDCDNIYIPGLSPAELLREKKICDDIVSHGFDRAKTMVLLVIVIAELLRGFTIRSLRVSIFSMGFFSNKYMPPSVLIGIILTVLISVVPGLQSLFDFRDLDGRAWGWVVGVSFIPCVVEEIMKAIYRATGFGRRANAIRHGPDGDGEKNRDIAEDDFKRGGVDRD